MKITIGENKFEQTKIKGRFFRRLLEIQEILEEREAEGKFTATDLDLMTEFISEVFEGKFTSDTLYDELEVDEIMFNFKNVAEEISKKSKAKIEKIGKNSKSK